VLRHIEGMDPMGTVWELLIIHLLVGIHPMVGHSLGQAVGDFHGAEAAAGVLVAGEGSVVGGKNYWLHGDFDGTHGDRLNNRNGIIAIPPSDYLITDPHLPITLTRILKRW
jgi:hypothetical protein